MLQMYALRLIFVAIRILSVYLFLSFKLGRCWTLCTLCGTRTHTCNQKKNLTKFTDLNLSFLAKSNSDLFATKITYTILF